MQGRCYAAQALRLARNPLKKTGLHSCAVAVVFPPRWSTAAESFAARLRRRRPPAYSGLGLPHNPRMNAPVTTPQLSSTPPAEPSAGEARIPRKRLPFHGPCTQAGTKCPARSHHASRARPRSRPRALHVHMPVDVRNLSLALLALFASVALLHWAAAPCSSPSC